MRLAFILAVCTLVLPLAAQDGRNELGLLIGGEGIPSPSSVAGKFDLSASEAWQITYARRFGSAGPAALYFEAPFLVGPSHSVKGGGASAITSLATLYLTPGLRLKLNPNGVLQPWVAVGGGYGLYEGSARLRNGIKNVDQHVSSGTLQWGGGVDVKTPVKVLVPIGLRFEFRDFYTLSPPDYRVPIREGSQHNYVGSGGLVLRWGR